jgi:hypothetical protein
MTVALAAKIQENQNAVQATRDLGVATTAVPQTSKVKAPTIATSIPAAIRAYLGKRATSPQRIWARPVNADQKCG